MIEADVAAGVDGDAFLDGGVAEEAGEGVGDLGGAGLGCWTATPGFGHSWGGGVVRWVMTLVLER